MVVICRHKIYLQWFRVFESQRRQCVLSNAYQEYHTCIGTIVTIGRKYNLIIKNS